MLPSVRLAWVAIIHPRRQGLQSRATGVAGPSDPMGGWLTATDGGRPSRDRLRRRAEQPQRTMGDVPVPMTDHVSAQHSPAA
jgi:hypothetical protein